MSVSTPEIASDPVAEPEGRLTLADRLYRLSVEQYHRIGEAGIIVEGAPVELLEGLLVTKMSKNPRHIIATVLLDRALHRLVPDGWFIASQNPVTLPADDSEPEPDAEVVRGDPRAFLDRKPGPGDVALVIEVSDTSLRDDLTIKKRIYARSSVPVYWIINLKANRLEVYDDPTGPADAPDYRRRRDFGPGDEVPLVLDGREVARIAVKDLLP